MAPPPPAARPSQPTAPVTPARRDVLPSVTVIDRIPIPEPGPEAVEAARLARAKPAGFWVRVVAALIDGALIGIATVLLSIVTATVGFAAPGALKIAVMYGIVTALALAYPIVFWAVRGATPGKMLLHLAVVRASTRPGSGIGWSAAIVRGLGYVASGLVFGVGFLLVAFTSQKQGLHDLIAGTRVLKLR